MSWAIFSCWPLLLVLSQLDLRYLSFNVPSRKLSIFCYGIAVSYAQSFKGIHRIKSPFKLWQHKRLKTHSNRLTSSRLAIGNLDYNARSIDDSILQMEGFLATALHKDFDASTVKFNTTSVLLSLISFGDNWQKGKTKYTYERCPSHWKRVPGCMADVRLGINIDALMKYNIQRPKYSILSFDDDGLTRSSEFESGDSGIVVDGIADSRVALGMLALICEGIRISKLNADQILALSSDRLSAVSGFDQLLPSGRLNGFKNMILLIQDEVRSTINSMTLQNAINPKAVVMRNDRSTASITSPTGLDISSKGSSQSSAALTPITQSLESQWPDSCEEVAMLLSGGVDSSVALCELLRQGYRVRAFYLKIWLEDEVAHVNLGDCPWEEDMQFAQAVCDKVGVPLETVSLQREYWDEVVAYTLSEARAGRTPNPDIMCNSRIKFGMFYQYVGRFFKYVATGHYAQVMHYYNRTSTDLRSSSSSNPSILYTSPDAVKDQTYFLCNLRQEQLCKALFPIGHLTKPQVRDLAVHYDLPTKARKDSQGICFLGKLKFDDFIRHYLGDNPGPILDYRFYQKATSTIDCNSGTDTASDNSPSYHDDINDLEVMGTHRGLWYHTIGQRKGLGLLLTRYNHNGPYYVAAKDCASNTLFVTNDLTLIERPRREFFMQPENMNWLSGEPLDLTEDTVATVGVRLKFKLRHSPYFVTGALKTVLDTARNVLFKVELDEKDKGIAPGQFAAIYRDVEIKTVGSDGPISHTLCECIGTGVISETGRDEFV